MFVVNIKMSKKADLDLVKTILISEFGSYPKLNQIECQHYITFYIDSFSQDLFKFIKNLNNAVAFSIQSIESDNSTHDVPISRNKLYIV